MKILLVTNNFTPYSGGVVSSLRVLVDALQQHNFEVQLVTLSFLKEQDDPLWVKRLYCPIRFMYKMNHMAIAWCARKQMTAIIDEFKPDVVHVHHPFLLGYTALRVAKRKNIPVVFTYHTIYEAYAHYVPLPHKLVTWSIKRLVLRFCSRVDGIIAPSSYIAHHLKNNTIAVPTQIILSGLLPEFIVPFMQKNLTARPIQLLTVSRMVYEKNIKFLIDVAYLLEQSNTLFEFRFIGYGVDYEALRSYAYDTLCLSPERVIFMHKPSKQIIAQAYQQADLFLFASASDTQAIVLAEAMAAGAPVIALDGPGQRDIIKQGANGYIVGSQQEMLEAILRVANQEGLLQSLSQGAYETGKRYYPEAIVKQVLESYIELLHKK